MYYRQKLSSSLTLIGFAIFSFWVHAEHPSSVQEQEHPPKNTVKKLKHSHGYILVNIQAEGVAPSIHFHRKGMRHGEKKISPTRKGFHLISVPAGKYQISKISAPLFNLPHIVSLRSDPRWAFTVEKKKINYIGNIHIAKERKRGSIYFSRTNQIAAEMNNIKLKYFNELERYPLTQGFGSRDDFLTDYTK